MIGFKSIFTAVMVLFTPLSAFNIGTGIYDMTGPAVEINFMGYAVPSQRGSGIHLRLRSRAFVFQEGDKNVAVVSVDGGMGSDLVNTKVVERLEEILGKGVFPIESISISGTHTHSGPAGFLQYVLYQVTSLGFVQETFDAWVEGITQSIVMAHSNLQPAKMLLSEGNLFNTNINRSPTSYLRNPEEERDQYKDIGDTDKRMLLMQFIADNKEKDLLGVLNYFAVHGTSMNNTNTLISGDNRGYASYLLEKEINGPESKAGMGPFVAAFASTNLGDVSPNTMGAKCIDTGLDCDAETSTCNGKCETCIAFGPGKNGDIFESTEIIGRQQYDFAKNLMKQNEQVEISGVVDYRHSFVRMSTLNVTLASGDSVTLCSPAMGYAFAAGTTDGPGMFGFTQGTTTGNPFWDKVSSFLSEPTQEEIDCQAPKPILLNTGDVEVPYEWDPEVVPIQIIQLGNLFILSAPSEFTTMAGRRLRNTVKNILMTAKTMTNSPLKLSPDQDIYITIAGLANTYSSYVTTYEEYQAQRYEAASTIFGPHTLEGYIQEFSRLAWDLVNGKNPSDTGEATPDLYDEQLQLMPEAKYDSCEKGASFGDVMTGHDAKETYKIGEKVEVTFHAANPRNNQRVQDTYLTVEQVFNDNGSTSSKVVATDGDWSTKFHWQAGPEDPLDLGLSSRSKAILSWDIPSDVEVGKYRMCYFGDYKLKDAEEVVGFNGCSREFMVLK